MSAGAPPIVQGVVLGVLFVAIAAVTDTVYAVTAGAMAPLLARARGVRALGPYLTGGVFVGRRVHGARRISEREVVGETTWATGGVAVVGVRLDG